MVLQPQSLGSGPRAFLKIKQMRLNREQRQMPAYSRKIRGIMVAFLAYCVCPPKATG